jgi:hypothetical protein
MTVRVTVSLISAEQFGLTPIIEAQEDQQRLLLSVPPAEINANPVRPAIGAIAVTDAEDTQPLSYAVPQLTGGW